jgi:lipopolysaccharide export system protein LptC
MMPKHNAFYGYVIVLAIVSSLLAQWWLVNEDVERREAVAHSADFFSVGYKKWQMNEQGGLGSHLTANKMTHYSDDGTTHLENPLMFFYNVPNPAWQIQAESGKLEKGGETLWLNGRVEIERAASSQGRELIIHTSNLQVLPKTSFAQTKEFTELKSGNNITTGTGMKATFSAPVHLELLANIHGKYETK